VFDRRQRRQHFMQHRAAVVRDAAPDLAVHRQQHLGRNLAEAVEHGHRAHVGAAHAPDRADAGAGQQRHHGLGRVGQVGADAVARHHARALQARCHGADLAPQFGPAHRFGCGHAFVLEDDGRLAGGVRCGCMSQCLSRVVDLRAGKPHGARHDGCFQHAAPGRGRLDLKVLPDRRPER